MSGVASVAAFVLAGGKSTRMGADKAFVELDGCTLLDRALGLARSVAEDVRIVGDPAKFGTFAPVVDDVYRDCGPLGGIHAALRASSAELNLILAVDMPFVVPNFLWYLFSRARQAAVCVPQIGGRWQPLCAVYGREFGDAAESALQAGRYKIDALYGAVKTQVIEEAELVGEGFSVEMFRNLNTKKDLETANN